MVVTALYAGLLGALYLALTGRIMLWRMFSGEVQGAGPDDAMLGPLRAQVNFAEYVPLAVVLLWLVESTGAPPWGVHALGGTLVVARVLHAIGLSRTTGVSVGRRVGTGLTVAMLVGATAWCLWAGLAS